MLQIELVLDEVARQSVEKLRIAGWIRGTHVVDRIDEPDAQVMAPDAIADRPREIGIVWGRHPVNQLARGSSPFATATVGRQRLWGSGSSVRGCLTLPESMILISLMLPRRPV